MSKIVLSIVLMTAVFIAGCAPTADQVRDVIKENPDIVFSAIEADPGKFIDVVNEAAKMAQQKAQEDAQKKENEARENEFKNPKTPSLGETRVYFGPKDAKVTIVEYSDFECPYCSRGYRTVKQVMKEYGKDVRILFKHLPLDFHPKAMPAAIYYEAIAKQKHEWAEKFHDKIFENQSELRSGGEKWMKSIAKDLGVDMAKFNKDIEDPAVKAIVEGDMEEARKFGFSGTPGFLINGVSLRGAYPFSEFKKIIDRHLGK